MFFLLLSFLNINVKIHISIRYGTKYFNEYAETIPDGYTSQALSNIAKELKVFLVGGTIPERDNSDNKLYNTCTVWSPSGDLIAKYRKVC